MSRTSLIQVRRDTEANWVAAQTTAGATPVLAAGEIGFISSGTNAGKFKIGDGTSLWGALTYATDTSKLIGTITPSAGTVTDTSITSSGLSQSSLNFNTITTWSSSSGYTRGDLVQYQGVAYRSLTTHVASATAPPADSTNWGQVSPTPSSNSTSTISSLVGYTSSSGIGAAGIGVGTAPVTIPSTGISVSNGSIAVTGAGNNITNASGDITATLGTVSGMALSASSGGITSTGTASLGTVTASGTVSGSAVTATGGTLTAGNTSGSVQGKLVLGGTSAGNSVTLQSPGRTGGVTLNLPAPSTTGTLLLNDLSNVSSNPSLNLGTGSLTTTSINPTGTTLAIGSGSGSGQGVIRFNGTAAGTYTILQGNGATGGNTMNLPTTAGTGTLISTADTGTVTNTMLAGSIAASKITGTAITQADTGTVTSTMILDGTIVDADISTTAGINTTKLAATVTKQTATYTVLATDYIVKMNNSATATITLPTASSYTGRTLKIIHQTATSCVSANSDVVPLNSATASTAIFSSATTAGKWTELVSDGTNWLVVAQN